MPTQTTISHLPNTILMEILAQFPLKMVLTCKCVSKPWYHLLSDPFFARLHLAKSPPHSNVLIYRRSNFPKKAYLIELQEDKDEPHQYHKEQFRFSEGKHGNTTAIFGSCHGLLLVGYKSGTDLYVYNPIVRTRVYLPHIGNELEEHEVRRTRKIKIKIKIGEKGYEDDEKEEDLTFCGIGYSERSDNYKVVKIRNFQAKVCVLGGDSKGVFSWRDVDDKVPFNRGAFCCWCNQAGVSINGAIYWCVFQFAQNGAIVGYICGFDIETERFYRIRLPPEPGRPYESDIMTFRMCSWNGFVAVSCSRYGSRRNRSNVTQWSVWVMKEYMVEESWRKEFSSGWKGGESGFYHLGTLSNGEVILACLFHPHSSSFRVRGLGPWSCIRGSDFRRTRLDDCFIEYAYEPSCLSPKEL